MSERKSIKIELACFDLGGVVVRTCGSSREGSERAGVAYHPEADDPVVRARMNGVERAIDQGLCTIEEYYAGTAAAMGGVQPVDEIRRIHEAWIRGEYPGMLELVHAIRAAGVATACLSNTNERHWEMMTSQADRYPAFAALDFRIASCRLGLVKPDPAIYRACAELCGVQGPGIVFFDDRPENVAAARKAGWHAAPIDPRGTTAAQAVAVLRGLGVGL